MDACRLACYKIKLLNRGVFNANDEIGRGQPHCPPPRCPARLIVKRFHSHLQVGLLIGSPIAKASLKHLIEAAKPPNPSDWPDAGQGWGPFLPIGCCSPCFDIRPWTVARASLATDQRHLFFADGLMTKFTTVAYFLSSF